MLEFAEQPARGHEDWEVAMPNGERYYHIRRRSQIAREFRDRGFEVYWYHGELYYSMSRRKVPGVPRIEKPRKAREERRSRAQRARLLAKKAKRKQRKLSFLSS